MVLTEDLDRLNRSQSDIAMIFSLAEYHGVEIRTVFDGGRINDLHVGMKGAMSALELKKISERTRRGQRGSVKAGRVAGGLAYGYAVDPWNAKGEIEPGHRRIVPEQAEIVRRIYCDYLDGKSPNRIVHELNRQGVPGPRGGRWNASTVTGHWGRMNGILQNPIYKGVFLWNCNNWDRHPVSGKRVWRPNGEEERVERRMPHLAIVPEETWEAVQKRRAMTRRQVPARRGRIPKFDFTILCDACGGRMVPSCGTYLRCYNARRTGTCTRTRKVRRDALVRGLFEVLRDVSTREERQALESRFASVIARSTARIGEIDGKIAGMKTQSDNLLNAVADGVRADELIRERLERLNADVTALRAERRELVDLPSPGRIDPGRLERAVEDATDEEERRMLVDLVVDSVHVGYDAEGDLRLSGVELDLRAVAGL